MLVESIFTISVYFVRVIEEKWHFSHLSTYPLPSKFTNICRMIHEIYIIAYLVYYKFSLSLKLTYPMPTRKEETLYAFLLYDQHRHALKEKHSTGKGSVPLRPGKKRRNSKVNILFIV